MRNTKSSHRGLENIVTSLFGGNDGNKHLWRIYYFCTTIGYIIDKSRKTEKKKYPVVSAMLIMLFENYYGRKQSATTLKYGLWINIKYKDKKYLEISCVWLSKLFPRHHSHHLPPPPLSSPARVTTLTACSRHHSHHLPASPLSPPAPTTTLITCSEPDHDHYYYIHGRRTSVTLCEIKEHILRNA